MSSPSPAGFPLADADLCVKCGLCLPHCPTYQETRHEGDSPRGRISLMQGLATGVLERSASLERHLDGCLGCRACEKVCPAKVPYGELIDAGRAELARHAPQRTRLTRLMAGLLRRRSLVALLRSGLRLYQALGLQGLIRRFHLLGHGRLARLESLLPARIEAPGKPPAMAADAAPALLFAGCVGAALDQASLQAMRRLYARCGITLQEPPAQTCCGALQQHNGLPGEAEAQVLRNLEAFAGTAPIVFAASGCGATLLEYARLSRDLRAADFVRRVRDPHALLAAHWPAHLSLKPLPGRVLLHLPCSQRNVVGGSEQITALLRRIPGLEIVALDESQRCCGAAGSYFITEPEMADRLLARKLDGAASGPVLAILSSNIGCSLHLAGGLRRQGLTVPVLHPLQLLAQQLPDA
ncbi:MAG TPA: heterodisulfide reductase-related iron-sulfur binding cluster [Solimonas sp.]|nr:heterodisulfide reductase-related iron-sulfur binding cluster [Solimonas sp.]